jgi:DNA adenine methylase
MGTGDVDVAAQTTLQASAGLKPVLRWAGGKARLVPRLLGLLPGSWNRYVEPMAGGGALFFAVCPSDGLLADVNVDLMNFYHVLRTSPDLLVPALLKMRPSRDLYYELRDRQPADPLERAKRFAYLNRLAWNGLYRVNRDGRFNVPMGDRLPDELWVRDHLLSAAAALRHTTLLCQDVLDTLAGTGEGDFVFLDPPYPRGARRDLGFNRYSAERFGLDHHRRLGTAVSAAMERGAKITLMLGENEEIVRLYPDALQRSVLVGRSLISCDRRSRRSVRELVLRSFT